MRLHTSFDPIVFSFNGTSQHDHEYKMKSLGHSNGQKWQKKYTYWSKNLQDIYSTYSDIGIYLPKTILFCPKQLQIELNDNFFQVKQGHRSFSLQRSHQFEKKNTIGWEKRLTQWPTEVPSRQVEVVSLVSTRVHSQRFALLKSIFSIVYIKVNQR